MIKKPKDAERVWKELKAAHHLVNDWNTYLEIKTRAQADLDESSRVLDQQDIRDLLEKAALSSLYVPDEEIFRVEETKTLPPGAAVFLFSVFGPKDLVEAMLGDLSEKFEKDIKRSGLARARLLYWSRTVRSMLPLMVAKLRNWGILAAVIAYGRRKIGW